LIATVWGLRLGLGTAILSGLVFNFFYLPPLRKLSINTQHDIVALIVFVMVAVAGGTLAELARARAAEAGRRRGGAHRALAGGGRRGGGPDGRRGERGGGAAALRRAEALAAAGGLARPAHAADRDHRRRRRARLT